MARKHRLLQPAPIRQHPGSVDRVAQICFYDLPPELRNEIYELALLETELHILPPNQVDKARPHPLVLVSKQIRNEVLPIMHCFCPIKTNVTDFDFKGVLDFLDRIPPDDQRILTKNSNLQIWLCTSSEPPNLQGSFRKWLHYRGDKCRPQPNWRYSGPSPNSKVSNDLRRKLKRMSEKEKKDEFAVILRALKIELHGS